jgi:hypothetical protein
MANAKTTPARPSKRKPRRAAPLRAATASVRKKKTASVRKKNGAREKNDGGGHIAAVDFGSPPLAGLGPISRTMNACIEFQARLLRCQTPFDVWREQSLFAARLIGLTFGQPADQDRSSKRVPPR